MKLSELIEQLAISPSANSLADDPQNDPTLIGVAALDKAQSGMLSFVEGARWAHQVQTTQASVLILPRDPALQAQAAARRIAWILADQPRYLFACAIACFYHPWQLPPEQHSTAVTDATVLLGENVGIGAHAVIHAGVILGNEVQVHANVVIYPDVTIGDRTVLHANCVIHERTQIGADCTIHSGAVIGAAGFGYIPMTDHVPSQYWHPMPQAGRTILEDRVVVGSNTTIDRSAVGDTRIGAGTKIDNLVQIGHGCQIGADSLICAQVGLAGATHLGQQVMLAGQVGVSGHITLGDHTIVAAQSGVHQSLGANTKVAGYPAIEHRLWLRVMAQLKKLPQLWQRVKHLEQRLQLLQSQQQSPDSFGSSVNSQREVTHRVE